MVQATTTRGRASSLPPAPAVELTGSDLTVAALHRIARRRVHVTLPHGGPVRERVDQSAEAVRRMVDEGQTVYGVTTGFGAMANVLLPPEHAHELQVNLIHFHRAGVGEPLSEVDVRAAMAARANSNLRGASGLRWVLIERLVRFLNEGVTPVVRRHGSIGASGDLTPLAAIAGAVVGLDDSSRVRWRGRELPALTVHDMLGLKPITLEPKEALALMNGTAVSVGMAANCLVEIRSLLAAAVAFHALAVQAITGSQEPFEEFIHAQKPHPGQAAVAATMRRLLAGSAFTDHHDPHNPRRDGEPVQDRYSVRCLPQYLGPAVEATWHAERQLEVELNSASDNPLIDVDAARAWHGGNFLAEHVATALDSLRSQVALIVKHADVQLACLMTPEFSHGLPPALVGNPDRRVNMGLKAAQISANSLMPLVLFYGAPVAHLYATHAEQYNQNVNSLSMPAAHLARAQIELARSHLAITLLCACQAVDLRAGEVCGRHDPRAMLSPATRPLYEAVRAALGRPPDDSRPLIYNDDEQRLEEYIATLTTALDDDGPLADAIDEIAAEWQA
jgi:phenylalanine ammonia-lyase